MAEVHADLESLLERPVKDFLSKGLSGARPSVSARAFSTDARVHGRRSFIRWHLVAVVCALACVVVTLLRVPSVNRAFASVPLLGDAYTSFLKQVNLDAAYQAGLLTRLDRTVTKDGLILTVIDAGVDGDEIVVSYSISPASAAEEDPDSIWARVARGEILLVVGVGGHGTTASLETPNEESNRVYGMVRANKPKGFWSLFGARITLSLEANEREPYFDPPFEQGAWKAGRLLYSWEISVPVRAVEVEPTVVPINKELIAGKDIIVLDRLILTPWRTVIQYTVRNAQPGITPNKQYWQLLGDCLSVGTSDGRPVRLIGGPAPEGWGFEEVGHGEAQFEPVAGRDFAIMFKTPWGESTTLRLPLEEKATISCFEGEGALKVEAVKNLEGGLEVTLRLESELRLQDAGVQLVDNQGRPAKRGPFVRYGRGNTVTVPFVTNLDSGPYHLEVDRLFALEPQGTVVFEVKVSGDTGR
ncbi:MAG TPA: DUF4179 domain-containing protein [Firmicutes bacterium]|nr:DUF4179 domain-containing protein [Candidatus Fermentithermobacillaceae bacterium]